MNNILIQKIEVISSSWIVNLKINVRTNNKTIYFKLSSQIERPYLKIKYDGYVDINIIEKSLSQLRGFLTDKKNYKKFEKMIAEYSENNIDTLQSLLLKYFNYLIKNKMGILNKNFKKKYIKILINLGLGLEQIEEILLRNENQKILKETNE